MSGSEGCLDPFLSLWFTATKEEADYSNHTVPIMTFCFATGRQTEPWVNPPMTEDAVNKVSLQFCFCCCYCYCCWFETGSHLTNPRLLLKVISNKDRVEVLVLEYHLPCAETTGMHQQTHLALSSLQIGFLRNFAKVMERQVKSKTHYCVISQ